MAKHIPLPSEDGYIYIEVHGESIQRLTFKRSDKPGALVEVTLNGKTINVEPRALLAAAQALSRY